MTRGRFPVGRRAGGAPAILEGEFAEGDRIQVNVNGEGQRFVRAAGVVNGE